MGDSLLENRQHLPNSGRIFLKPVLVLQVSLMNVQVFVLFCPVNSCVCILDLDICFLVLLLPILPGFSLKKHGSSQEGFCQIQRAFGAPYPPRLVGMMSETGSWGENLSHGCLTLTTC